MTWRFYFQFSRGILGCSKCLEDSRAGCPVRGGKCHASAEAVRRVGRGGGEGRAPLLWQVWCRNGQVCRSRQPKSRAGWERGGEAGNGTLYLLSIS